MRRVMITSAVQFDDLLGDDFSHGVVAVRQPKRLEHEFVGFTEPRDVFRPECRFVL
jgi:hypothetical protein